MLPKIWKKIALTICIIAVLFNITSKLIKKTNLKDELQSVMGGEAITFSEEDTTSVNNSATSNNTTNAK